MNKNLLLSLKVSAALGLCWAATPIHAAEEIVFSFDTADSAANWSHYWGAPTQSIMFDPEFDAAGDLGNSGAVRFEVDFDVATHGGENQFCFRFELPTSVTGTEYEKLALDVLVDPSSPARPPEEPHWDFGDLRFGTWYSDWSQNFITNSGLSMNGGWQHLEVKIPSPMDDPKITNISGVVITMWSGDATWGQTGKYIFWVDNVKFIPLPPPAVGTNVINAFDDPNEVYAWERWWGNAITLEFDPSMDAQTNFSSGSMKLTLDFDASLGGDNQFSVKTKQWGWDNTLSVPTFVDGLLYTNLEMDVFVDPNSVPRGDGAYGYFEFGIWFTNWSGNYFCNTTLRPSAEPGWTHISAPMPETDPLINGVAGLAFKMWSGGADAGNQTGPFTLWVDNIKMVAKGTNEPVVIKPALTLTPAGTPGLHLTASASGQYQRQSIRTVVPNNSWTDKTMEYSITIAEFPDTNHLGFQAHMFLVPTAADNPLAASDNSPDWSQPNCIFFTVIRNADGTALGEFRYKTNQPNGNAMFYNSEPTNGPVGYLGNVSASKPEGKWTIRMDQSSITLITADATNVIQNMPIDMLELFPNPVFAYFGIQPNNTNNLGQSAVISEISISSPNAPDFVAIKDQFKATTLDTTVWEYSAADSSGVTVIDENAAFWLSWTLPDTGFQLYWSPTMATGSWVLPDPALPAPAIVNGRKRILVPKDGLPLPNRFFALIKK